MHFVLGVSIKEIARRMGRDRNTVRRALRAAAAPKYSRPVAVSKLDPFEDEIHRLLKADGKLTGQRVRELIAPLGFDGGKTIVDDYLREVRPLFDPPRTFQRTIYRPGEICQFDLWEPKAKIAVGHGQTRKAWVVIVSGLFACGCWRVGLLQADRGSVVRDPPLSVVVGGAA